MKTFVRETLRRTNVKPGFRENGEVTEYAQQTFLVGEEEIYDNMLDREKNKRKNITPE